MRLNDDQVRKFSQYFVDISKIIFTATVIGFFVPSFFTQVTITVFTIGTIASLFSLYIGIRLLNKS